jgi:hypothetical protein
MKKVTKTVAMFVYRFSGLRYVVDEVRSFVFRYKLRVRMVPVSYKLFVLLIGMSIGGSGVFVRLEYSPEKLTFENPAILPVQAKEVETVKVDEVEKMADYIWMKESTRGKNNYSKCEEVGKVNGVGYAIPGDGSYVCFDSHEEEMQVLKGWIIYRRALGWSDIKMLCAYSGNNYDECKK